MGLGIPELVLILAVVLIVFGAGRLPEAGKALPRAMRDFRSGVRGELADPEPAAEPRTSAAAGTSRKTRPAARSKRRSHPLRPLGLIIAAVGMLIYVADSYYLNIGLTAQVIAGVVALIGAILIFL